MFVTYGQGYAFLFCAFIGIMCGLIYEAGYLVRFCCKKNIAITFIVDIIFCILCAAIILPSFFAYKLEIRAYVFIGLIAGFILERISAGFFIAKCADVVYNTLKKFGRRFIKGRLKNFFKRIMR